MKYKESIVNGNRECYFCKTTSNLERHEIFFGVKSRKKSIVLGLWVYLCMEHHRGTNGIHGKNGSNLNQQLKEQGQVCCMREYDMSVEEFTKLFTRNYL